LKQSIIRYVGYFPAMMALFIGIFWVAFDKRKQGWHDKMANTVVIRTNE
ncbi:MAG: RDD family protein, partial [Acinetobacter sp.]|nr:RDD family protein [Acinetobacter sp.]